MAERAFLPFCFTSFVAFGLGLVLVGANQAELSRQLGVQLAGSGMLAAALSLGLGVGVVASLVPAWRVSRFDPAETLRAE